jgi:hypothetical protein
MRTRLKATVTLVLIAPILTEIVSGNTPPRALLHPSIDLFLIAVYSLPLLLLRELSIRWRLRMPGLFLLGLAYGFLNEGLVAQTLIRYEHVPMKDFDHYICGAGINFSWVALIVPWHSLMAMLFPIALLGLWFPARAEIRWLGRKAFAALAIVVSGGVVFLGLARTPHFQMRLFLLAMAVLVSCAWLCRGRDVLTSRSNARKLQGFAFGMGLYLALFLGATILAGRKVAPEIYFPFVVFVLVGAGWIAQRNDFECLPDAAMVAFGAYFVASVFNGLGGFMRHSLEAILCGAVLSLAFVILWWFSRTDKIAIPTLAKPQDL